jgi:hypothetical protein
VITAKVKCTRNEPNPSDDSQVLLEFQPDYNDNRNQEWSKYTPALSLAMTVKAEVAEHFGLLQPFTLQFVPTED